MVSRQRKNQRTKYRVSVYFSTEVGQAIQAAADAAKTSVYGMVRQFILEGLQKRGFMPSDDSQPE